MQLGGKISPVSDVVLVLLVLVIITGTAMAAAGKFAGLREHKPDTAGVLPDVITAQSLANVRFGLALRGYRMSEVDAVLDAAAARIAELEGTVEP